MSANRDRLCRQRLKVLNLNSGRQFADIMKRIYDLESQVGELLAFKDEITRLMHEARVRAILPEVVRLGYSDNPDAAKFLKPVKEEDDSGKFAMDKGIKP